MEERKENIRAGVRQKRESGNCMNETQQRETVLLSALRKPQEKEKH